MDDIYSYNRWWITQACKEAIKQEVRFHFGLYMVVLPIMGTFLCLQHTIITEQIRKLCIYGLCKNPFKCLTHGFADLSKTHIKSISYYAYWYSIITLYRVAILLCTSKPTLRFLTVVRIAIAITYVTWF